MNKGTVTKLKNWLVANFDLKLVESSSTDSFYLTNDSVSIRISDHIQGSDFNKIRFEKTYKSSSCIGPNLPINALLWW